MHTGRAGKLVQNQDRVPRPMCDAIGFTSQRLLTGVAEVAKQDSIAGRGVDREQHAAAVRTGCGVGYENVTGAQTSWQMCDANGLASRTELGIQKMTKI